MIELKIWFTLVSICLGGALGSFLNVIILRLHHGKKGILWGRSHCFHCNKQLKAWELIPIFSFLALRGRCSKCHKPINWRYLLIEISTAAVFASAAWVLFPIFVQNPLLYFSQLIIFLLFGLILIFLAFYDLYFLIIPDSVSLPAILIALAATTFPFTPTFLDALVGALIPFSFFFIQILISQGKWVGGGDLRLGALMGAILGVEKVILALFVSYFLGAIIGVILILSGQKNLQSKIPFGPFLAIGTWIALLYGEGIIAWYFSQLLL